MPMLPWPVCPLAGHAKLGQNVVVGSMLVSSESRWGTYQEEVCLDPHFHCKRTIPRLSVELPRAIVNRNTDKKLHFETIPNNHLVLIVVFQTRLDEQGRYVPNNFVVT